jgi:hypothetical protein
MILFVPPSQLSIEATNFSNKSSLRTLKSVELQFDRILTGKFDRASSFGDLRYE